MATYRELPNPVPTPTPISAHFWAATREHQLLLQRCTNGHVFYYARSHCPECLSNEWEWFEATGRGTLYSFTVARRPQSADFAADVPYVIAAVTLDEGPRMTTLLVDVNPEAVRIDSEVEVTWQDVSETISMPYFRPVG